MKTFIATVITILLVKSAFPCSMYKITANGKTIVGNNEDSWGRDSRIWFEPGKDGTFGVVNVGYARKYPNPDGAMNERGLAFDAFTMPHKTNLPPRDPNKKDFDYALIKTIMQQYETVDKVYAYLSTLNLHVLNGSPIFNGGMLLFVDKSGKYLVVEASKMTLGNDDKFALANFSVCDTKDLSTIKTERYRKGITFLSNKKLETDLSFCSALSDTMSVTRPKIGDGTLYTNIYDLDKGLIHLYFYHDFNNPVTFNLKDELMKGNHFYELVDLFPNNKNYQQFLDYKTPQNNNIIFFFLIFSGLLFFFSAVFFLRSFFKKEIFKYFKLTTAMISNAMLIYVCVLLRNQGIFYFPAPYEGPTKFISITSYVPFLLAIIIIPFLVLTLTIMRQKMWNRFATSLLITNNVAYFILTGFFVYWELF